MSNTYNETVSQIIADTLALLGVVAAGETVTTADYNLCLNGVNKMIKAWMAQGIHLWTEEEGTVYFINGQPQYNLKASNGANACNVTSSSVETTLSAIGSGTSITVTSSTGMSIGDNIGIELSSTSLQWTTITNIVENTITLNTALTSSAASGNQVYSYPTASALGRVLSIQTARIRDENNFDRSIMIKPRADYMKIPQKLIPGYPTVLYYSPQIDQGEIYLWPCPNDVGQRLKITYLRPLDDLISSSDYFDLPDEWLEPITYNLAVRMAPAYGLNLMTGGMGGNPDLVRMAKESLEELKAWDSEQPYVQIVPGYRYDR